MAQDSTPRTRRICARICLDQRALEDCSFGDIQCVAKVSVGRAEGGRGRRGGEEKSLMIGPSRQPFFDCRQDGSRISGTFGCHRCVRVTNGDVDLIRWSAIGVHFQRPSHAPAVLRSSHFFHVCERGEERRPPPPKAVLRSCRTCYRGLHGEDMTTCIASPDLLCARLRWG